MKLKELLYMKVIMYFIMFSIMLSFCYHGLSIFKYINIFLFIIIIFKYIITRNKSKFSIALLIYIIMLFISTKLSQYPNVLGTFNVYCSIITLSLYVDMGLKFYGREITKVLYRTLYVLIFINFLTILLYPNGMYATIYYSTNWFLGYDNTHICIFLPALMLMLINQNITKKKSFMDILLICFITYSVFYCFSANSVVVYTIILIYIIFHNKLNKINALNVKNYIILYLAMFFGLVIFRIQEIFSWFIVNVLNKTITFTGRTSIWDRVILLIKKKPILGYGKEKIEVVISKLGHKSYSHAHNTILDILYKGGFISLLIMSYIIYICAKELKKYQHNKISKIVGITLFCFFIMSLFEAREEKIGLYIILIYAYNISYLVENKEFDQHEG